jgi:hypothetical protein
MSVRINAHAAVLLTRRSSRSENVATRKVGCADNQHRGSRASKPTIRGFIGGSGRESARFVYAHKAYGSVRRENVRHKS